MLLMVNPSFQQCTPGLFVVFVVCCLFVLSSKVLFNYLESIKICGRSVPYSAITLEILVPRENVYYSSFYKRGFFLCVCVCLFVLRS